MNWIDRLERRSGHLAIPGLTRIVVGFNALVYILLLTNPGFVEALTLDPKAVMSGQVWRLFTYVFIPASTHFFFVLIALYFLWFVGDALEAEWGAFRLNLFYFLGMFGCTIAAFFFGAGSTNFYLNLSLLFAFTTLYPNYTLMLFLVLPVQAKWIGWFSLFLVALNFLAGPMSARMAIVVSLANYLLFFGPQLWSQWRERKQTAERRAKYEGARQESDSLYQCTVCQRTDVSDPALEFRVGADGNDYCEEHLPGARES